MSTHNENDFDAALAIANPFIRENMLAAAWRARRAIDESSTRLVQPAIMAGTMRKRVYLRVL